MTPPRYRRTQITAMALAMALGVAATVAVSATEAAAHDWVTTKVDDGTKPALTVTPDGDVAIVYMLERLDGWVRIATLEDGEWRTEQIADGYFYGPPDIAAAPDGTLHAAYHDHQDSSFKPDKGDAVHVSGGPGAWVSVTAVDPGHDGWDNRISVDAEGRPHMVGVDPEDFGGTDGVEYYSLDDSGAWSAEPVGSGPQTYRWAVSVATDPDGAPWVSYYDGPSTALMLSGRGDDGWEVSSVDDAGDTGLYSELAIDATGGQHISYFERDGENSGVVKYAFREGSGAEWQIHEVDQLSAVLIGFTGARNITSMALDADGQPWLAYSDEDVMRVAQLLDSGWLIETVAEAGEVPLGQIVSLAVDAERRPHLAFAEVTDKGELNGSVWYATQD
jgi:hypothetical protein